MDDTDRAIYLHHLAVVVSRSDAELVSFALMSSHVHHGLIAGSGPVARFVHPLHTRFALAWHRRHGGLGPVFAARPSSWRVPTESIARMVAYHHRNPVDAGVVQSPAESRWTSHRYYLRLETAPTWLNAERALALCGFDDTSGGRRQFDEFVREIDLREASWGAPPNQPPITVGTVPMPATRPCARALLFEFVQGERVHVECVTLRARPLHPARAQFVRFALERGAARADIARVLCVGASAISKLGRG